MIRQNPEFKDFMNTHIPVTGFKHSYWNDGKLAIFPNLKY